MLITWQNQASVRVRVRIRVRFTPGAETVARATAWLRPRPRSVHGMPLVSDGMSSP